MTLDGMSTLDLTGRVALISGASRGIGHAIAAALLAFGAAVTITARKPDELAASVDTSLRVPISACRCRTPSGRCFPILLMRL
ncbi:MAG: SDR family NAD(P)-dependent oxidoreductase [Pseudonocardiaceae bacterium]